MNTDAEREPLPAPPVPPLSQEIWLKAHGQPLRVGPRLLLCPDGASLVEDESGKSWRVDPPADPASEADYCRRYWAQALALGVFAQSLWHASERGWLAPPKWDAALFDGPDSPRLPPADSREALARLEPFVSKCRREVEAWSAGRDVVRRRML